MLLICVSLLQPSTAAPIHIPVCVRSVRCRPVQTLPTLKSSELCQHCAWSCSQRPTSRRGSRPRSWDSWLGPLSRKDSRTGRPKCPAITDSEVLKPRHICSSIRKSRGMAPNHKSPTPVFRYLQDSLRCHAQIRDHRRVSRRRQDPASVPAGFPPWTS